MEELKIIFHVLVGAIVVFGLIGLWDWIKKKRGARNNKSGTYLHVP